MTIQNVINDIQDTILALSGIKAAPDYPPNKIAIAPAAITYPASGSLGANSAGWFQELHNVNIDLVVPMLDMTSDFTKLNPYLRSIPNEIFDDPTFGGNASTFDTVTYTLITFEDAGIAYRGYRFTVNNIKITPAIT